MLPICNEAIQKTVTLRDRRRLGFAEFGDQQGRPLFYFHGFPGSRLEARLADRISRDLHVRFIAIDRPGYGLSSFKAGRSFLDLADDVCDLADTLEIGRFSILGVSGGGPYAAACARKIPVYLWHGEKDLVVPAAMGHYPSETIPDCRATFYKEEGHFSIVLNRMEEIWKPFCV